jgi:uncharacterized membrane protein YagU involved in acid resistance
MRRDLRALGDGALGGAIATLAMSGVTVAARQTGVLGRHPPERITEALLDAMSLRGRPAWAQDVLAVLLHWGFGMSVGAVFVPLQRRLHLPFGAPVQGMVYGSMVWALSYKGWIPALGILPPPERDRPGRPLTMVVAHWVYGATLGLVTSKRARR